MSRVKKPAAPLQAWAAFGLTSAVSLLVGEVMWLWQLEALLTVSAFLVLVCTGIGIELLRQYGGRPLYVAVVVIGLAIGQFRMLRGFLSILVWMLGL